MKKTILVLATLVVMGLNYALAQQEPQMSMYMYNRVLQNPGYVGTRGTMNLTLYGRTQWVGVPGHPVTSTLSFDMPFKFLGGGIGGYLVGDKLGPWSTLGIMAAYSYHAYLGNLGGALGKTSVGIGLQGGVTQKSLDYTQLVWIDPNDPLNQLIQNGTQIGRAYVPDASVGAYAYSNKFYGGFSLKHLLQSTIQGWEGASETNLKMEYYVNLGYVFQMSNLLTFSPHILMKTNIAALQTDVGGVFEYQKKFSLGASYRLKSNDAITGIIAFRPRKDLLIGYSYDYTLSDLQVSSNGSHDIVVSYDLPIKPPAIPIYRSPRFR